MGNLIKHRPMNMDALREQTAAAESFGKTDFFTFVVGKNMLRFLPLPMDRDITSDGTIFERVMQHFVKGAEDERPAVFACPRAHFKKKCPACEIADQLRATGNRKDEQQAFEISPSQQFYANAVDLKNPASGPRVVRFGKRIRTDLVAILSDEHKGGDFTDPVNGFPIIIERTGTTMTSTKYTVFSALRQAGPLEDEAWIDAQVDLRKFSRMVEYRELQAMCSPHLDLMRDVIDMGAGTGQLAKPAPKQLAAAPSADDDLVDVDGDADDLL